MSWGRNRRGSGAVVVDEVQDVLCDLFAQILDVAAVGPDDDFFELGGDSMGATWVFAEVEERFGIVRPDALLLEAPTPRTLAAELAAPAAPDPVVVPVRTSGDRPALVAVHGGFGGILWSAALGQHLPPAQPLYGVRPPSFDKLRAVRSVPGLAAYYLDLIQEEVGEPASMLFGYSYGGIVAFEMALQLQARGQPPLLLALGDMPLVELSSSGRRVDPDFQQLMSSVRFRARATLAVPYKAVRNRARRARRAPWERRLLRRSDRLTRELRRLMLGYRAGGPLRGDVVLLRSDEHRRLGLMGWDRQVEGQIHVEEIPGAHADLLHEPAVRDVARALDTWITRVAGTS